jgi:LmbE family N-acetylglucosaminyl deacetylase
MYAFDLHQSSGPLRLLCVGAHADDIEIGCGGLILSLLGRFTPIHVDWIVLSASPARKREATRSARLFLKNAASTRVQVRQFRDGFFPYDGARIKRLFEQLKKASSPDLVLTHYRDDRHQDHRVVSELTWNTFRDHWVLEYEIPKFDGDLGAPNFFVPVAKSTCAAKVRHLESAFGSQRDKHWFSSETFMALMRLRGMECRANTGYAEAFYARKVVLGV